MKNKGGYGVVYQDVTRNSNLSAATKGLYAYLSSFCGTSDECYPSVETIIKEMNMGKDTFYRHINALVAAGVVEKHQTLNNGKFGRTIYRLTHEVTILDYPVTDSEETEKSDYPITDNREADSSTTNSKETNNNNIISNNIINNNISVCPELNKDSRQTNTNIYSLDTENVQSEYSLDTDCIHDVREMESQDRLELGKDIVRDSIELESTVCPDPDKPTSEPSGILLPLNNKSFYDVPQDKIDLWLQTYPAVNVVQELQKMRAWLDSNPTRRKTRQGINRFINSWLSREQDSDKGNIQNSRQRSQNCFNNFQHNDYNIEELEKRILSN